MIQYSVAYIYIYIFVKDTRGYVGDSGELGLFSSKKPDSDHLMEAIYYQKVFRIQVLGMDVNPTNSAHLYGESLDHSLRDDGSASSRENRKAIS